MPAPDGEVVEKFHTTDEFLVIRDNTEIENLFQITTRRLGVDSTCTGGERSKLPYLGKSNQTSEEHDTRTISSESIPVKLTNFTRVTVEDIYFFLVPNQSNRMGSRAVVRHLTIS